MLRFPPALPTLPMPPSSLNILDAMEDRARKLNMLDRMARGLYQAGGSPAMPRAIPPVPRQRPDFNRVQQPAPQQRDPRQPQAWPPGPAPQMVAAQRDNGNRWSGVLDEFGMIR